VYSEQSVTQWDNVSTGASMSSYGNRRVRIVDIALHYRMCG